MRAVQRFLLMCALAATWAEDQAPALTSLVVPSPFEDGQIQVAWSGPLKISQQKGIDFSRFTIEAADEPAKWRLSIYDGNHPQPLRTDPLRKREWWPFSRLSTLLIHRSGDGSAWGECMVPAGHQWAIDERAGTFAWTGPERHIHVTMWFASEADIEPHGDMDMTFG